VTTSRVVTHAVEPELRVTCRCCGKSYWLSARREREYRKTGTEPICGDCHREQRFGPRPTAIRVTEELRRYWLDRYTLDEIRTLAVEAFGVP
jgi:hypothetical protein